MTLPLASRVGWSRPWVPPWDRAHAILTPAAILEPVRAAMGGTIGLDPCTEPDNPTRAREFHALPDDGLSNEWRGRGPIWVNPPWGRDKLAWIRRALEVGQAGDPLALLVPAYTESRHAQAVMAGAEAVVFLTGAVYFVKPEGGTLRFARGVMLALWGIPPPEGLGVVMRP